MLSVIPVADERNNILRITKVLFPAAILFAIGVAIFLWAEGGALEDSNGRSIKVCYLRHGSQSHKVS